MLRRLLLAAVIAATAAAQAAAQEWKPLGLRNGVELAFRDDAALDAREMRAAAELSHAAPRITAVVCDFTQTLDPDVREARVLSGDLNSSYVIYLRYAPRYMVVAARDVVIHVQRHESGCSWVEQGEAMPEQPGTVRMPVLRGSWVIEPIDATTSRVTYQIAVKPGGRLPGWLVRRGAASALPDVIARVTSCLQRTSKIGERC